MPKILHVDDDEKTLRTVSRFLEGKGYQVVATTQPFIAPLIQRENPDLLLLDLNMPLLSGERLLQILASHGYAKNLKVLFFSGQDPASILRAVKETGAAGYVLKEEGLERLLAKIVEILGADGKGRGPNPG